MTLRERVQEVIKLPSFNKNGPSRHAKQLGITLDEFCKIRESITGRKFGDRSKKIYDSVEASEYIIALEDTVVELHDRITEHSENIEKGTGTFTAELSSEPQSAQEIEERLKITKDWKLVQYWNKSHRSAKSGKIYWTISGNIARRKVADVIDSEFIEFLKTYEPIPKPVTKLINLNKQNACFVFNKQDAHLNKFSEDGSNDIQERFDNIYNATESLLRKASSASNLDKLIYILGSDLMDSEHTGMTTKGTPQKSCLPYGLSFSLICNHEASMIKLLLSYTDELNVIYVPGNHDQYAGWHVVSWLKAYYRNQSNLSIDITSDFTKYVKYSNTAIMLNHGDGMKPEKFAQVFPIDFKKEWSSCDHHIILTGDKHHELSRDIGGIRFYRIPALSKSKSEWDMKHGWTMVKGELNAMLITEDEGVTDIYKKTI